MAVWLAALKQEHPAVGRDAGVCNALYKRGLCQTDMLESAAVPHRACKADVHVLPSANFMQKAKCSQHKQTVVPTQDCAKHVFKPQLHIQSYLYMQRLTSPLTRCFLSQKHVSVPVSLMNP